MSFRIEDILKKDSGVRLQNVLPVTEKSVDLRNNSILQQTLLTKSNPYYYTQFNDCYTSEKMYSNNVLSCEKMYYLPHHYQDHYIGSANSYMSLYARSRLYCQPYENYPMMFYGSSSKRKGGQVRFSSLQTDSLEKRFVSHKYLSPEDRKILADSLKLSDKQVKTWFQNRRAKWRRSNSVSSTNTDTDLEKGAESDSEMC